MNNLCRLGATLRGRAVVGGDARLKVLTPSEHAPPRPMPRRRATPAPPGCLITKATCRGSSRTCRGSSRTCRRTCCAASRTCCAASRTCCAASRASGRTCRGASRACGSGAAVPRRVAAGGDRRDPCGHALAKRQRACADIGTEQIPDRYLSPRTLKFRLDVLAELPPGFFATFWGILFGFPVLGLRGDLSARAFVPPPPAGSVISPSRFFLLLLQSLLDRSFDPRSYPHLARLGIELCCRPRRPARSGLRRLLRRRHVLLRPARAAFRDREPRFARCPNFLAEFVLVRGRVRAMRR